MWVHAEHLTHNIQNETKAEERSVKLNRFPESKRGNVGFSSNSLLFSDELMNEPKKIEPIALIEQQATHSLVQKLETKRPRISQRKPIAFIFCSIYLLGTLFAGIIYHLASNDEQLYLDYYLQNLMRALNTEQIFSLFVNNFSLAIVSLSSIFLLGLSAFGVPLLILFIFIKGIGSGLLFLQLFLNDQWNGVAYYFATVGLAEVCLATSSCILCVASSKSAIALFHYTFFDKKMKKSKRFTRLGVQYFILLFLMLLACLMLALSSKILLSFLI